MPLATMDQCLYGKDHDLSPEELGPIVGFTPEEVARAYATIDAKRNVARYLAAPPVVLDQSC